MNAREGRPSSHEVGARQSTQDHHHTTTTSAFAHGSAVSTPTHKRWRKRRKTVTMLASDVLVWSVFTILTGVVLLACCLILWMVAP